MALLRSPHAHARIIKIDIAEALALEGVYGVLTGSELVSELDPLASAVRMPVDYFPIASEKVRYVGEPVALVAAFDRYIAEDALEKIVRAGLVARVESGYEACSLSEALRVLDHKWDNYFQYNTG